MQQMWHSLLKGYDGFFFDIYVFRIFKRVDEPPTKFFTKYSYNYFHSLSQHK